MEHYNKQCLYKRYYKIADIVIEVKSQLPFLQNTFKPIFSKFEVADKAEDTVSIYHHFFIPTLPDNLGILCYDIMPWKIYKTDSQWIYLLYTKEDELYQYSVFNHDHSLGHIYNKHPKVWTEGNNHSLTLFPTDQIYIAALLVSRQAFYLHSAAAIIDGKGMIFTGHSGAGKTTMSRLIQGHGTILCDDRNIVRKKENKWYVYGTWSHGDLDEVSEQNAIIHGVYFIEKSAHNKIEPINKKDAYKKLLSVIVRPFETKKWWTITLDTVYSFSCEVPIYTIYSNKSAEVVELLMKK